MEYYSFVSAVVLSNPLANYSVVAVFVVVVIIVAVIVTVFVIVIVIIVVFVVIVIILVAILIAAAVVVMITVVVDGDSYAAAVVCCSWFTKYNFACTRYSVVGRNECEHRSDVIIHLDGLCSIRLVAASI